MKKLSFVLFLLLFITITKSIAQTDFYVGKWDIEVKGSPRGDIIFATDLIRKDGKLTGELVNGDDKRPITRVEESGTKLLIYFMSSQGNEIFADLEKADANTLKGNLMGYNATATRFKENDFFAGKWEISILGTPNGDAKMIANFIRKDGTLTGEMSDPTDDKKEKVPVTKIEEESGKITIYFSASGYDLNVPLEKVDDNNLQGKLMNMFETKAVRIK